MCYHSLSGGRAVHAAAPLVQLGVHRILEHFSKNKNTSFFKFVTRKQSIFNKNNSFCLKKLLKTLEHVDVRLRREVDENRRDLPVLRVLLALLQPLRDVAGFTSAGRARDEDVLAVGESELENLQTGKTISMVL